MLSHNYTKLLHALRCVLLVTLGWVSASAQDPCANVSITPGAGNITVGGLNGAPVTFVQVWNGNWQQVFSCQGNCNTPAQLISNLPNGQYFVKVDLLTAGWQPICKKEGYYQVSGTGGSCSLTYGSTVTNKTCSNNGTPNNPSDDTWTVSFTATVLTNPNNLPVWGWNANVNGVGFQGMYGMAKTFGPYPIAAGNLVFTVNDDDNPTCKQTYTITPPTSCSNAPTISINDVTVNENAGTATLTVSLSSPSGSPVTVNFSTANGTANAPSDYITSNGTVTIPAGQTSVPVNIPITDDAVNEPTENFTVNLSNPVGATISDGTGVVTILDNDQAPACNLAINITQKVCNNNGTPNNPNDDTYTFSLNVTGGPGATWTAGFSHPALGAFIIGATPYNTPVALGPFPSASFAGGNSIPPIIYPNGADISISVSDSQTPSCTKSTTVFSPGPCSTQTGPDCTAITFTAGGGNITVGGLVAPIILVQAFNASWAQVFNQTYTNSPGTVTIPGLASGTYFVKVDFLNAQWSAICKKEQYITVVGGNPPVANPDVATTPQNTPVSIPSLTNDNLNGGTFQMLMIVGNPSNGTATVNGTSFQYTPNAGFSGIDQFTYKIVASNGTSNVTTVTITVPQPQTPPVANPDVATTPQNTPVNISSLTNDNLNGGTLQMLMLVGNPSNGFVIVNGTNFQYTPNAGFSGTDQFTYKIVASNGTSNVTTVTITVPQPQTPPVANPDVATTPQNTPVNISSLTNDNLNGGTLQMLMLVGNPSNGFVIVNGTNFQYTPNAGFSGTDQFTYKIVASNGTSNITTVTVTVAPPPCTLVSISTQQNIVLTAACAQSTAVATWAAITATTSPANCANVPVNCNFQSGASFPVGTTTVTCTATFNGQTLTSSFTVTVNAGPTGAPVLSACPSAVAKTAACGQTTATATWTAPTATSACGTPVVTSNFQPGASFPLGTTTVIYTATANGQSRTCSFAVTVTATALNPVSQIAYYCLDQCYSNSSNPSSGTDYSEFVGVSTSFVNASALSNNSGGMHSCTPGFSDLGMCTMGVNSCTASSSLFNSALKFTLTANVAGSVNRLFFYQRSSSPAIIYQGNSKPNNILTKLAVRVSNGSTVVYENYAVASTTAWGQVNLTFPTPIAVAQGAQIKIEIVGFCPATTNQPNFIFDIDEIRVFGATCGSASCSVYNITSNAGTSCSNGTATNLYVHNISNSTVKLYCKNGTGQEIYHADVTGGVLHTQPAIKGQVWVLRNLAGTALKTWTITACNQTVMISCTQASLAQPHELTFDAYRKGFNSELKWLNNTGHKNEFFDIEHSTDGVFFTKIGRESNAGGQAGDQLYFQFFDRSPVVGDNVYRLKMVWKDGTVAYSTEQTVHFDEIPSIGIYPNPAVDQLFVDLSQLSGEKVELVLINNLGIRVFAETVQQATDDAHRMDIGNLHSGSYRLFIQSETGRPEVRQVIVEKF